MDVEKAGYRRAQNRFGWEHDSPPEGEPAFIPAEYVQEFVWETTPNGMRCRDPGPGEAPNVYWFYPNRWRRQEGRGEV